VTSDPDEDESKDDYVRCIADPQYMTGHHVSPLMSRRSLCGKPGYEWRFVSLAHADATRESGYLDCCPECRRIAEGVV